MAINFGDNFNIAGPLPVDRRYYNNLAPYADKVEVFSSISETERYIGLTVLVESGGTNVEYWFKDAITGTTANTSSLVEKKYTSEQLIGDFVTGATNLGYFTGTTGVQRLALSGFPTLPTTFDGLYYSEYQWYYADAGGIIRIGSPSHNGPLRRAYVKADRSVSWIWDVSTAAWILSYSDVVADVGMSINPYSYAGTGYTQTTWITGYQSNGSTSITGAGGLNTGTTEVTVGNPIYAYKEDSDMHLFTPISDTPEFLKITSDDYYIRFSGVTAAIDGLNVGGGKQVYKSKTGTTLNFRTVVGSGDTTVTQVGDTIAVYSAGGTGSIIVKNLSGGTGEIYKDTSGTTMNLRTLKGTGDVTITTSGDTVIIDSQAGGTYDLASPSVIDVGGIPSGTTLTGKTAFELWEELLVPTQYPTLTAPYVSTSLSVSGTYEVGTTISSLDVCSSYNAGCINPQYTATCDKRSCGVIGYCYGSTGGQCDGYYVDGVTLHVETIPTYTISAGTQTWCTSACRCAGVQPYDSKGTIYSTPLTTGFTNVSQVSLTGIYAWFWGTHPSGTPPDISTAGCAQCLLNTYTCNCLGSSTGTINVNNFAASGEFVWFAIPACAPTKTNWEDVTNPSNVGSIPGILMGTPQIQSVNSPDACGWTCNYEFYVSNYATNVSYGIDFCN